MAHFEPNRTKFIPNRIRVFFLKNWKETKPSFEKSIPHIPTTNKPALIFYMMDALPVTQPTVLEHWKPTCHSPSTCVWRHRNVCSSSEP